MLNFRTQPEERLVARERRARLRALGRCVNGPESGFVSRNGIEHGPPVGKSGRCQRCIDQRKQTEIRNGISTFLTIREVVEAHAHLALDNEDDREALIHALETRRRRRRIPIGAAA